MNHYETVFIATPVLSDVQTKELFGKFQGVITENGGQIVSSEDWGLRKLAYPIQKKTTGFYYLIEFEGEGDLVEKLETQYRRFKKAGIKYVDYKDAEFLKKFLNEQGKLLPRRLTGTSQKYQKKVATAVKRARHLAMLPFVTDMFK